MKKSGTLRGINMLEMGEFGADATRNQDLVN